MAPYCAILRYYCCDTPYRKIPSQGGVRYTPWHFALHGHICAIPLFAASCAIMARYALKGRQEGIGKKVTKNVKKVTTWLPKGDQNRKKCVPPFCGTVNKHERVL